MLPLAMRRDLMSGKFEWQGNYLVNPWAETAAGSADHYPRMAAYLSGTRSLRDRSSRREPPRPGTGPSTR